MLKIIIPIAVAANLVLTPLVLAQPPASGSYAQVVLTNKPLAYWRLNDTTDPSFGTASAIDASSNGFNGTYGAAAKNGFNNIAGPRPPAFLGFEAGNTALQNTAATAQSWVTAPQPTLNTNTVTIAAWIYPNGDMADWSGILMNRGVGTGMGFGGGATHGMLGYTWNNNAAATYNFNSGLMVPLNQWSFVAVVIEPTKATLYLGTGGALSNSVNNIAHTSQVWGGTANIGADPTYTVRNFNGAVDDVAVFNRSLSNDDINTLYGMALVNWPPAFSRQPTSKALYAGRPAIFQTVTTGVPPRTYQWKKGGVNLTDNANISGSTTATLTIGSVTAADAGDYTLTVSNASGTTISSVANLTVVAPTGTIYEKAVMAANPLAYWRLNETNDPSAGTALAYDYWGGFTGNYGYAAQNGFNVIAGPRPSAFPGFEANNSGLLAAAGTDQSWVTAPQPTLSTNTVTITAWLYPNGDMADWSGIFMNRVPVGTGLGFGGAATHGMLAYTWNNNNAATYNFVSGLTVPQNQWSFVAVVIEPTKATLYLGTGGVLSNAVNAIAHTSQAWGGNAAIGTDPGFNNARVFNGMVDEVTLFKRSLTFDDINTLYGSGLGKVKVVAPVVATQPTSLSLYAGRPATFQAAATGSSPLAYQWQKGGIDLQDDTNISGSSSNILTLSKVAAADAGNYTLIVTNAAGSVTSSAAALKVITPIVAYEKAVVAANPLAYWRFNETNDPSTGTALAYDYWGGYTGTYGIAAVNGFNGIAGPIPPTFSIFEASNMALQATASTAQSWVTAPQPPLNTNTVSIAGWVFPNGDMADWSGILMNRSTVGVGFGFGGGATHGMLAYTWNNNSSATYSFVSGLVVPQNQWSFVALVVEPTKATLYLYNKTSQSSATNAIPHTSEAWGGTAAFGNDPGFSNGRVFNGAVDEVALFNYSLTPAQVLNLYNGVVSVPASVKLSIQNVTGGKLQLSWPQGALQEAASVTGPWTANSASSPYTVSPTNSLRFYRVQVQ